MGLLEKLRNFIDGLPEYEQDNDETFDNSFNDYAQWESDEANALHRENYLHAGTDSDFMSDENFLDDL